MKLPEPDRRLVQVCCSDLSKSYHHRAQSIPSKKTIVRPVYSFNRDNPALRGQYFSTIINFGFLGDGQDPYTRLCIIGSGPTAHTVAICTTRAKLKPVLFKGWMANGIAPEEQLTTTINVDNFSRLSYGIQESDLTDRSCKQFARLGTELVTKIVIGVGFSARPSKVFYGEEEGSKKRGIRPYRRELGLRTKLGYGVPKGERGYWRKLEALKAERKGDFVDGFWSRTKGRVEKKMKAADGFLLSYKPGTLLSFRVPCRLSPPTVLTGLIICTWYL